MINSDPVHQPTLMLTDVFGTYLNWLNTYTYTVNDDGAVNLNGTLNLEHSNISRLPFKFDKVSGDVKITFNDNFETLEGCPSTVLGNFTVLNCSQLTSLEDAPKYVGGMFICQDCWNLKSLKGLPPGCIEYIIDGFTQEQIDQYFESLELKDAATGDPTFDDFFGIGED